MLAALTSAAPDPAAQLRATLETTVALRRRRSAPGRVLYVEALGNEALNRRRIDTGHAVATFVQDFARTATAPHPRASTSGAIAASILVGGLSELIVAWLDGRIDIVPRSS